MSAAGKHALAGPNCGNGQWPQQGSRDDGLGSQWMRKNVLASIPVAIAAWDISPLKYNLILHITEIFATIFSFYLNRRLLIHEIAQHLRPRKLPISLVELGSFNRQQIPAPAGPCCTSTSLWPHWWRPSPSDAESRGHRLTTATQAGRAEIAETDKVQRKKKGPRHRLPRPIYQPINPLGSPAVARTLLGLGAEPELRQQRP
ncbi:hypothetical protein FHX15_002086 [Rhizobium sp. BK650]|nr:hypothetical protein [Rhizobium sp. BK650]